MESCNNEMTKRMELLDRDLSKVRTGRASIKILDGIRVDYYGSPTPLNQVASLSTPDARTILVSPFEKKTITDIERAIQMADVGIQPNNDGSVIRLPIPQLTEDRRKEIAKSIKKFGEESKVGIRKIRQDMNQRIKKEEKDKVINEDESKSLQKQVQDVTDKYIALIDTRVSAKQDEVMKV
jgi:ribosome recycling factor